MATYAKGFAIQASRRKVLALARRSGSGAEMAGSVDSGVSWEVSVAVLRFCQRVIGMSRRSSKIKSPAGSQKMVSPPNLSSSAPPVRKEKAEQPAQRRL